MYDKMFPKIYLFLLFICIISTIGIHIEDESNPLVTTELGRVRGRYFRTETGRKYAVFEGIPYAKPPVHKNRFREARPIRGWNGVVEARFLHTCMQYNQYTRTVIGDEDCLHLNIYIPQLNETDSLFPVVVYIHGGAFMFGAGHAYQHNFLMNRNVVYVSFNYRLGPLGFLSTEDSTLPGNLGLKDQVIALQWIKRHIRSFGGDSTRVTITGLSAGGASVHLHYLSARSHGLFARGMSFSGTALDPWVIQEQARDKTLHLAASLGCFHANTTEIVRCLSYIPARYIVQAVPKFFHFLYNPFSPFGPVVEKTNTPNAFLTEHPYILLKTSKIQQLPWLTSITSDEGLYPAAEFWSKPELLKDLDSNWSKFAPHLLDYNYTLPVDQHEIISKQIKEYYFKNNQIGVESFSKLVQLIGDRLFATGAQLAAKLQAYSSSVYIYRFAYRGAHSKSEILSGTNSNLGVAHCDDVIYVLNSNIQVNSTQMDRKMTMVLLDFWMSFIENGIPEIRRKPWKSVSTNMNDPLNFIEIQTPDVLVHKSEDFNNVPFWLGLPFQENQHLFSKQIKDEL